jgi:hypothetical protein
MLYDINSIEELCGIVMHYLCNMNILGTDSEQRLFKLLSERRGETTIRQDHGWELDILKK